MVKYIFYTLFVISSFSFSQGQEKVKTIHVYVALCDNENQGIVPVNDALGNGQDPKLNLYWGALYGIKTHFKKSADWTFIKTIAADNEQILERILFKHKTTNTYLLADAYNGKYIKQTTIDFLKASGGDAITVLDLDGLELSFGGASGLVAYIGHDGLMEFNLDENFTSCVANKDAIMLACVSQYYFTPYIKQTGANPLIWSTGLMAPEAYTLKAAIDGWIINETDLEIRERAVVAYHLYQKSGMNGARNLLVTGF